MFRITVMTNKVHHHLVFTFLLLLVLLSGPAWCDQESTLRVEPPTWWTGFKETSLQLMVYGDNISTHEVALDYPGVSVSRIVRVKSPNYLFVYLDIGPDAKPGEFDISITGDDTKQTFRYQLRKKNPDPAHTKVFSSADSIYLITPDRCANGNPDNDNVESMGDTVDRSNQH